MVFWMDETNFNLYCSRRESRSKIGARASIIDLACIGAMSCNSIVHFTTRRGAFTAEDCKQWFRELMDKCIALGYSDVTIIIDNAPAHSRLELLLDAEEYRNFEILWRAC